MFSPKPWSPARPRHLLDLRAAFWEDADAAAKRRAAVQVEGQVTAVGLLHLAADQALCLAGGPRERVQVEDLQEVSRLYEAGGGGESSGRFRQSLPAGSLLDVLEINRTVKLFISQVLCRRKETIN